MFSPGKYEQKDGLPRASNIFFPLPVWLLRGSGASLGNKRSRQRGEKDGGRRLKQGGRGEGCSVAFCILRAGFLRRHDVRFHLGSVRRRANSAHEPTHRRLCIKCPTLCAAAYFFTASPPYTSLSVGRFLSPTFLVWTSFLYFTFLCFIFPHDLKRGRFRFFF